VQVITFKSNNKINKLRFVRLVLQKKTINFIFIQRKKNIQIKFIITLKLLFIIFFLIIIIIFELF